MINPPLNIDISSYSTNVVVSSYYMQEEDHQEDQQEEKGAGSEGFNQEGHRLMIL